MGWSSPPSRVGRVLIVDDDAEQLRACARVLTATGHEVATASDGGTAVALIERGAFDVIVSDIMMPRMDGLRLLREARKMDLDVPVVLMTAGPSLETAMKAIDYGALRYLSKPVDASVLKATVSEAVRLHHLALLKRQGLELLGKNNKALGDLVGLEVCFARAIEQLWMAYQPIVDWPRRSVIAYEALVRTREPTLPHPGALFDAAARLGRLDDLGRRIRDAVAVSISEAPRGVDLFVNLHTHDLLDERLYAPDVGLSKSATRVVLEITERASLEGVKDVTARVGRLRDMGFRIAIDDLGAGYAGLTSFAQLRPDVAKIDMTLVRGIDRDATRQKLVASLAAVCRDLGMRVVTEGVETPGERDMVAELGCELLQGYLFAKPSAPFCEVKW